MLNILKRLWIVIKIFLEVVITFIYIIATITFIIPLLYYILTGKNWFTLIDGVWYEY